MCHSYSKVAQPRNLAGFRFLISFSIFENLCAIFIFICFFMLNVYSESSPQKCRILVSDHDANLGLRCYIDEEISGKVSFQVVETDKYSFTGEHEKFYCSLGLFLFQGRNNSGHLKLNIS